MSRTLLVTDDALIIREMITDAGTKRPISEHELAKATGIEQNLIRGCMLHLAPRGIVRRIDTGKGIWEISHDFLARLLSQIIYKWKKPAFPKLLSWIAPVALVIWVLTVFVLLPSLARDAHTRAIQEAQLYGFQIRAFEDGYQANLVSAIDSLAFQRAAGALVGRAREVRPRIRENGGRALVREDGADGEIRTDRLRKAGRKGHLEGRHAASDADHHEHDRKLLRLPRDRSPPRPRFRRLADSLRKRGNVLRSPSLQH